MEEGGQTKGHPDKQDRFDTCLLIVKRTVGFTRYPAYRSRLALKRYPRYRIRYQVFSYDTIPVGPSRTETKVAKVGSVPKGLATPRLFGGQRGAPSKAPRGCGGPGVGGGPIEPSENPENPTKGPNTLVSPLKGHDREELIKPQAGEVIIIV